MEAKIAVKKCYALNYFIFFIFCSFFVQHSHSRSLIRNRRAFSYIANETVCMVDNVIYHDTDPVPTDDPCESCKCRPPGFSCVLRECKAKPGCKQIRREGECCPQYQCGCEHNGKFFQDGDRIPNAESPCYSCHCQGSSIICALADCKFRFDCEPEYVPNECCPRYDHCPSEPTIPSSTTVKSVMTSIFTSPSPIFISTTQESSTLSSSSTNALLTTTSPTTLDALTSSTSDKSSTTPSIPTIDEEVVTSNVQEIDTTTVNPPKIDKNNSDNFELVNEISTPKDTIVDVEPSLTTLSSLDVPDSSTEIKTTIHSTSQQPFTESLTTILSTLNNEDKFEQTNISTTESSFIKPKLTTTSSVNNDDFSSETTTQTAQDEIPTGLVMIKSTEKILTTISSLTRTEDKSSSTYDVENSLTTELSTVKANTAFVEKLVPITELSVTSSESISHSVDKEMSNNLVTTENLTNETLSTQTLPISKEISNLLTTTALNLINNSSSTPTSSPLPSSTLTKSDHEIESTMSVATEIAISSFPVTSSRVNISSDESLPAIDDAINGTISQDSPDDIPIEDNYPTTSRWIPSEELVAEHKIAGHNDNKQSEIINAPTNTSTILKIMKEDDLESSKTSEFL